MSSLVMWLRSIGIDLRRLLSSPSSAYRYLSDRKRFRAGLDSSFAWGRTHPMLGEWSESSGSLGAYFHQDLLVARWVLEAGAARHVDVGSRIDGFIGHLSLFREVEVLDIRPQSAPVKNVVFHQLDLMKELPVEWREATPSLSCLHTIEHFGLGRYGDTINPDGYLKGLEQLKRLVVPGGLLYLSTPIGPQRVEFNAHRVFALTTVLSWFGEGWVVERLAVIDDAERVRDGLSAEDPEVADHFGCHLGVGIVVARKLESGL